jgi:hypothetical protein
MAKKQWSDLTASQKRAVYVGGAIESVVTAAALRDLLRRPSSEIRGPKLAWVLAFFVQPFGPIAYFTVGRS